MKKSFKRLKNEDVVEEKNYRYNEIIKVFGLAALYLREGFNFYKQGDYEKAIENYKKALEYNPKCVEASNNMGILYYKQGDYEKALESYKKSIDGGVNSPEIYNDIGNVYFIQNDYEKAIENYKKALEYNPKCVEVSNNMGILYYKQGDYEKALESYKKSIDGGVNSPEIYNNIGNIYSRQGNYEKAIENYNKVFESDLKHAGTYNNIGNVYFIQNDYEKASENYKKALKYDPNLVEAKVNICLIYIHKKKYKKSLKWIKEILKLEKIERFKQHMGLGLIKIFEKYNIQEEDINLLIDKKLYFSYHVLQKIIENIKDIENRVPNFGKMLREKLRENITKNNFKKNSTNQLSDGIFYMCKSINKYTIESLINKGVYKNKVTNFNDPFDPYFKMLNSDIIETLNKVRITCFSEEEDNLLLWAHYADNHKGICLGYSIMENDNSYFEKIIYKSFRMKKNADYILTKSLSEFEIQENNITLSDFYLRKNENWQYEKEYRLIHLDIENEEDYYKNVILKEVIFGMNTEIKDIKLIYEIVKNIYGKSSNIKFYKMREGKDLTIEKFPLDEWANNNGIELNFEN